MADLDLYLKVHTGNAPAQLDAVTTGVKNLGNQTKSATRISNGYGQQVDKNTVGLSKFAKSGLQQTGYQVGDFAVQISGGTSALQAFGQQGSQLLGIFGATGALLGAGVAIIAGLGNAYMKTRDQVEEFTTEVENLNTAFLEFRRYNKTTITAAGDLGKEYFEVTEQVKKLFEAQKQMAQFKLNEQLNQVITALETEYSSVTKLSKAMEIYAAAEQKNVRVGNSRVSATEMLGRATGKLMDELNLTKIEATALAVKFTELNELDAFAQPEESARKLLEIQQLITSGGLGEMTKGARETAESVLDLSAVLQKMAGDTEKAAAETNNMFGILRTDANALGLGIAQSFGDSFKKIMMGTESVKDAFKNMASSIISQLIDVLVIQRLVGGVGTGGAGTGGTGLAGLFTGTRAVGGQVTTGQPYLVGENGPELFRPSASGTIIPNNKMGGGSGVVVNQTINISTGVAQTVRTEIATLMPQIAEASKAAVLDAKQRGGNFSRAF